MTATTIGAGADTLELDVSEDAYQGDAQFTVGVDGQQVGGVLTSTTPFGNGFDRVDVLGNWAAGPHTVTVNFLNDAWGGTDATDRNLFLGGAVYDNAFYAVAQKLYVSGPVSFGITDTTPVLPYSVTTVGSGSDTLALKVSEDAYQGDAQFTVSVDGQQVGDALTTTSAHGSQSDLVNVLGNWAAGPHTVTVNFLNDAWGGSADTDRNLYVDSATFNDAAVSGASLALNASGPQSFGLTDPGSTFTWSGVNTVSVSTPPQPEVNPGDTLNITNGTFVSRNGEASSGINRDLTGVTVDLVGPGPYTAGVSIQDGSIGKLELVPTSNSDVNVPKYGNLYVAGNVTIDGPLQAGGRFMAPGFLTVNLNGPATLNLNGGALAYGSSLVVNGSPGSTVTNTGTLSLSSTGQFAIHADLAGVGTIRSLPTPTSSGVTIELDGVVSAEQTVQLDGGTLQLDQPMRFMGTVAGFLPVTNPKGGPASSLQLEHTTVTGASFQQLASNAGDLSIFTQDQGTGAAGTDVIHVAGSFASNAFVFTNNAATQSALIQLSLPQQPAV